MASTKSPELSATEIELKRRGRRRLIGAVTIGLLGIVFLPMIFDGEPRRHPAGSAFQKQEISVQVPAKEGQPALPTPSAAPSLVAPLAAMPTAPVDVDTAKLPPSEAAKNAPVPVPVKPPVAEVAAKADKPPTPAKPAAVIVAAAKTGFAVQLGAFGDPEKAKLAIALVKDTKLPVYTEKIAIKTGTVTRIRIGPFATRAEADSALAQIKLGGSDGTIVPLQ